MEEGAFCQGGDLPVMASTSPTSPDVKLRPPSVRELTVQSENIYRKEVGLQMVHIGNLKSFNPLKLKECK